MHLIKDVLPLPFTPAKKTYLERVGEVPAEMSKESLYNSSFTIGICGLNSRGVRAAKSASAKAAAISPIDISCKVTLLFITHLLNIILPYYITHMGGCQCRVRKSGGGHIKRAGFHIIILWQR